MGPGGSRTTIQAPVGRIGIRPGRRPLDEAHVANLMVSFQEIGQRTPISLKPVQEDDPDRATYTWWLNAGGHRLEAKRRLGARVIDAIVEDDDELTGRIAEVDENLIRRDYTALERAQAVASRLEAWAGKYPDRAVADDEGNTRAKRGRPAKLVHGAPFSGVAPTMGFALETAGKVGLSTDTIKRDLALHRGIPAGLQERLHGTWMANHPGALRQLAALGDAGEQMAVAQLLIDGKTKSVSDARAMATGNDPSRARQTEPDQAVKAFRAVWKQASPSARTAILHELAGLKLPAGYAVIGGGDE